MTKAEKYTLWMESIAADQKHGYSQQSRWGTPDYDCSSLVISALEKAGIPAKSMGATYTGNMYPVLKKLGFADVASKINLSTGAGLKRGDILLNDVHHTAVYCGDGRMVHARGQSFGSPSAGDQGQEIAITNYYNYPWDHVLRYGEKTPQSVPQSTTEGIVGTCSVTLAQMVEGAVGEQVKTLQTLLNMRGYRDASGARLDCDGEFGPCTAQAVERLQRANNFPSTTYWGTVAADTWSVLIRGKRA